MFPYETQHYYGLGMVTLDNSNIATSGFKPLTSWSDISGSVNPFTGTGSRSEDVSRTSNHIIKNDFEENVYQNIQGSLSGSWQRDENTGSHSWKSASTGTLDVRIPSRKHSQPIITGNGIHVYTNRGTCIIQLVELILH